MKLSRIPVNFLILIIMVVPFIFNSFLLNNSAANNKDHSTLFRNKQIEEFDSKWIKIKTFNWEKCVKNSGNNNQLVQQDCKNSDEFLWKFQRNPDGSFIILSKKDNNVWDMIGEGKTSDKIFTQPQNTKNDNLSQTWLIDTHSQTSTFHFKNKKFNKCFNINGSDGFILMDCRYTKEEQAFYFIKFFEPMNLNKWIVIVSKDNNMCVNFDTASQKLTQVNCSYAENKLWMVEKKADGSYTITSKLEGNILLKVNEKGELAALASNGKNTQEWNFEEFSEKNHFLMNNNQNNLCITNSLNEYEMEDCLKTNINQAYRFDIVMQTRRNPIVKRNVDNINLRKYFK